MLKFSGNGVGKRVLSAFLCAVLSFSNVQIAYAGESTEEISQEGAFFASESNPQQEGIEGEASEGMEAEPAEKGDREEISKESPSNLRDKKKENIETENTEAENAKGDTVFLAAGEFEETTEEGILVRAKYGEDTFPEGTFMRLRPVEEEETLSAMKEKVLSEKEKGELSGQEVELRSFYAVDIGFFRVTEEGEEVAVQPKKGKAVQIELKKSPALEEALSIQPGTWVEEYVDEEEIRKEKTLFQKDEYTVSLPEGEELSLVHLPEGREAELLPLTDSDSTLRFSGKEFSPYGLAGTGRGKSVGQASNHSFQVYWKEAPDPQAGTENATTGHSYSDPLAATNIRERKNLQIIPPAKSSNQLDTSTMMLEFTLKGNKDTKYPPGSISIDIPESVFKSWSTTHPTLVAYKDRYNLQDGMEPVQSQVPKAPETNSLSDFNYTEVERPINGKKEKYYHLVNHSEVPGAMILEAEFAYPMRPTMVQMEHKQVGGKEIGEYRNAFPVFAEIHHPDSQYNASMQDNLSVTLQTEVKPFKMTIKHGTGGKTGGLFYKWDPAWGDKPADADSYFYVPWYIDADRPGGSSQGFTYSFHLDNNTADGGQLVGVKKMPQSVWWNRYTYASYLDSDTSSGSYPDIARYMHSAPPQDQYWLVNPIGRTFVGINKEPVKRPGDPSDDTFENSDGSYYDYDGYPLQYYQGGQRYVALYRYPMTKITDAIAAHMDMVEHGFLLKNKVSWTETWADGYTRNGSSEATLENQAKVILPLRPKGKVQMDKNNTGDGWIFTDSLQTLFADGAQNIPISGNARTSPMYYLFASNQVDGSKVVMHADGTYTVPETKIVLRDDGEYYLYTLKNNVWMTEPLNTDPTTAINLETGFREPGTAVYKLKEEDYYYDSVSIKNMEVYDVEQVSAPVNYTPTGRISRNFASYAPVELWIRKKGHTSYEKYGSFQAIDKDQFTFTPESGYSKVTAQQGNNIITSANYLDLKAAFPGGVSGIEFRNTTKAYQTNLQPAFGISLTPSAAMREQYQKALNAGLNSAVAGPGYGKADTGADSLAGRLGKQWDRVAYVHRPMQLTSSINKYLDNITYSDGFVRGFKDDPVHGEQLHLCYVDIHNQVALPEPLRKEEYLSPYLLRDGIIYDLLPAGTYVKEEEIHLGPNGQGGAYGGDFDRGDYQVEFIENWEDSGQTMMKVSFKTPAGRKNISGGNASRIRLGYIVHNPYSNILDRGRILQNTAAFLNTSKETKWIPNFSPKDEANGIPERHSGRLKEPYFQKEMENAWNADPSHYKTMSVTDMPLNYEAITIVQAGFSNYVSTEVHKPFAKDNVSYMGDPYRHRLLYQALSSTRTTDIILFDILGEEQDRNGDFDGIDISSFLNKKPFEKGLTTENPDVLEPVVYYSTVVPTTEEQRSLGAPKYDTAAYNSDNSVYNPKNPNSIWKVWDYKHPENNTGVNKKDIKAIAIDARTTKAGKRFILDTQGKLVAYVKMTASMDKKKLLVHNVNTGYLKSITFNGEDVPASEVIKELEAPSSHNLIAPVQVSIPVKKVLDGPAGVTAPNIRNAFRFTLKAEAGASLLDGNRQPVVTEKTNPDADGGLLEFGPIEFIRPGTYTYTVTETGNFPRIKNDLLSEKTLTVTVTNPDDKKLSYSSTVNATTPLTFTNTFGIDKVKPKISIKKVLEHYGGVTVPDIKEKYSFTLAALDGAPMPAEATGGSLTKTNPDADGGEISFGEITYSLPGEYRYTVTESGSVPLVENDKEAVKNLIVKVKDLGNGTMSATVSGDALEFRNLLSLPPAEEELSLKKEVKGGSPENKDPFRFSLSWNKTELTAVGNAGVKLPANPAPMPGNSPGQEVQITVNGAGTGTFEKIAFPAPGKYTYEVREEALLKGYRFDKSRYQVVFTVEEDSANPSHLTVKKEIFKDDVPAEQILFVNEYEPNQPGPNPPTPPTPPDPSLPPNDKPTPPGPPTPPTPTETPEIPPEPDRPSAPRPKTLREINSRIKAILGRKRPLTQEDREELEQLIKVVSKYKRRVQTSDSSKSILYVIFSGISGILLALYMALKRRWNQIRL